MPSDDVDLIIAIALCEDLGDNLQRCFNHFVKHGTITGSDITGEAIFAPESISDFRVVAKSEGILSGSKVFKRVFGILNKDIKTTFVKSDGSSFKIGDEICRIKGPTVDILKGERTALNFLGHLSGIATEVSNLIKITGYTGIKILDTRKTTPGMRLLEKEAVRHGGGYNHRYGLYDMVLIKDNHIDVAGSITEAVNRVRDKYGNKYKIEVETRNTKEVKEALECKVDRIMLDNMSIAEIKEAVELIKGRCEIEVSGNMNAEKINDLKGLKIDFVSLGYITYNVRRVDFSMVKL